MRALVVALMLAAPFGRLFPIRCPRPRVCSSTSAFFKTGVLADLVASTGADPSATELRVGALRAFPSYGVDGLSIPEIASTHTSDTFDGSPATGAAAPRTVKLSFDGAPAFRLFQAMTAVPDRLDGGTHVRRSPHGLVTCTRYDDPSTGWTGCEITDLVMASTSATLCRG